MFSNESVVTFFSPIPKTAEFTRLSRQARVTKGQFNPGQITDITLQQERKSYTLTIESTK